MLFGHIGCAVESPVFRNENPGKGITRPTRIGIVRLDTQLFLRTTGGVLEPNYEGTKTLQNASSSHLKRLLTTHFKEAKVVYPVPGLQKDMDRYGPKRLYVENVSNAISQVYYRRRLHSHLLSYSLSEPFQNLRERGYSHLLFYSAIGANASTGRTVATVQKTLLTTLMGGIYIPVLDFGVGSVMLVDVEENEVRFVNRITDPRTFTLTEKEEVGDLFQALMDPYFEALRERKSRRKRKKK